MPTGKTENQVPLSITKRKYSYLNLFILFISSLFQALLNIYYNSEAILFHNNNNFVYVSTHSFVAYLFDVVLFSF